MLRETTSRGLLISDVFYFTCRNKINASEPSSIYTLRICMNILRKVRTIRGCCVDESQGCPSRGGKGDCVKQGGGEQGGARQGACTGAATMPQPSTLRLIRNAAALAAASPEGLYSMQVTQTDTETETKAEMGEGHKDRGPPPNTKNR